MRSKKVVILGDPGVGKTTLAKRLSEKAFKEVNMTVGIEFHKVKEENLLLWDLAGQEKFVEVLKELASDRADLFIIVADSTSPRTFESVLERWIKIVDKKRTILVVNKVDLAEPNDEDLNMLRKLSVPLVKCSSKTGEGLKDLMMIIKGYLSDNK